MNDTKSKFPLSVTTSCNRSIIVNKKQLSDEASLKLENKNVRKMATRKHLLQLHQQSIIDD